MPDTFAPPDQALVRQVFGPPDGKGKPATKFPFGGEPWTDESPIPPWLTTWASIRCPDCGFKRLRSITNWLAYSLHYADFHLGVPPFRGWRPLGEATNAGGSRG